MQNSGVKVIVDRLRDSVSWLSKEIDLKTVSSELLQDLTVAWGIPEEVFDFKNQEDLIDLWYAMWKSKSFNNKENQKKWEDLTYGVSKLWNK